MCESVYVRDCVCMSVCISVHGGGSVCSVWEGVRVGVWVYVLCMWVCGCVNVCVLGGRIECEGAIHLTETLCVARAVPNSL